MTVHLAATFVRWDCSPPLLAHFQVCVKHIKTQGFLTLIVSTIRANKHIVPI